MSETSGSVDEISALEEIRGVMSESPRPSRDGEPRPPKRRPAAPPGGDSLDASAVIDAYTGRAWVHVRHRRVGHRPVLLAQLTPTEAVAVAMNVLSAAKSAESDAVTVSWLRHRFGLDTAAAAQRLAELRQHRAALARLLGVDGDE